MMSDADAAASIGCPRTDAHASTMYKRCDCNKKQTADTEHPRFPEHVKRQAVRMRIDGAGMMAAARVVGASIPSVSR